MARALTQRRKPGTTTTTKVEAHSTPAREHVSALRLPELDRLIHERIRLGIVSALATNASLSFNDLKRILKTTDGNLSVHARKLEEAAYVACTKSFQGRVPKTEYRLTAAGRKRLQVELDRIRQLTRAGFARLRASEL